VIRRLSLGAPSSVLLVAVLIGCGGGGGGGGGGTPPTAAPSSSATAASPSPTPGPTFTQFAIPSNWVTLPPPLPGDVGPANIVTGPDGALWFTMANAPAIGRVTTSGVFTDYSVAGSMGTYDITVGPDKALWFTDNNGFIGRMDTSGNVTNEYPVGSQHSEQGITVGPDGNLWFTDFAPSGESIGEITTAGAITLYPNIGAAYLTSGPDGAIWGTQVNTLVRLPTSGVGSMTYSLPSDASLLDLTLGPDNNLWVTDRQGAIYRVTTTGSYTTFGDTDGLNLRIPVEITANPDGNLYYSAESELYGDAIVRMSTSGVETPFTLPDNSGPEGITTGPSGNVWFAETKGNRIGELILH